MNFRLRRIGLIFQVVVPILSSTLGHAQQFNSDSYLSKPEGVATVILTYGERDAMMMTTFSLIKNWEFTAALYTYNDDDDPTTNDGYSSSFYFKYMFYENEARTGGFSLKAGTGLKPGYVGGDYITHNAFKTFWMNTPATLSLFDNQLSWDLMPGASITRHFESEGNNAWAFTYSTRIAWYAFGPELAIVGEIYGSEGEARAIPEYKIGPRWEPNQYVVLAFTYGDELGSTHGAGLQLGVMLFSPPFVCLGGCD